jgi:hypothetical protein
MRRRVQRQVHTIWRMRVRMHNPGATMARTCASWRMMTTMRVQRTSMGIEG